MTKELFNRLCDALAHPRPDGRYDLPFNEGGGVWLDPKEAVKILRWLAARMVRRHISM